jgi:hypothetical protein
VSVLVAVTVPVVSARTSFTLCRIGPRFARCPAGDGALWPSSIVLNIGEAEYSDPGNRRARFFTAAGSTNETRRALQLAEVWGYVSAAQIEHTLRRLSEAQAILWKLSY